MSTITVYDFVGWPTTMDQPDLIVGWPDGTPMAWSSRQETTEFTLGYGGQGRTPREVELSPIPPERPANSVTGTRKSRIMKRLSSDRAKWR